MNDDDQLGPFDLDAWGPPAKTDPLTDEIIARAREDQDTTLAAFDLSAWEAPAGEPGLADAVIARLHAPAAAAALEVAPPRRKRWWLAGGAIAASAATIAIALGVQHNPADGAGSVVATAPTHVALGASSADVDAGAEVHWRRAGHKLVVEQRRGIATWRVGGEDTLVIDGATVASIEAHGASLRVEVDMNLADARLLGATAATAVALAAITVIVYEGHVKVSNGSGTMTVNAGDVVAVKSGSPPSRDDADKLARLRATLAPDQGAEPVEPKPPAPAPPSPPAAPLDGDLVHAGMSKVRAQLAACGNGFTGAVKVQLEITPAGTVKNLSISPSGLAFEGCLKSVLGSAKFAASSGGRVSYPISFVGATCDAKLLAQQGHDAFSRGSNAAALASWEKAFACAGDLTLIPKLFLASCKTKNASKAKLYFTKLPKGQQSIVAACLNNGIDPRTPASPKVPPPTCDATALTANGDNKFASGQYAGALATYQLALACKYTEAVVAKAFVAACRSKNEPAAKSLFTKLPASRQNLVQVCLSQAIDPR